jgi:hypothetical protein
MYRIELSPGEETVFRSIEELAVAIKRGVITPRARIYHYASNKWLPIGFHPHYKIAVSMPLSQAALVAGPAVKQLSTLNLEQPVEPDPPVPVAPAPIRYAAPAHEPVRKKRARSDAPASEKRSRRQTKPRRQLRIALVGALLIGGAQWVLSAPLFSRSEAPALLHVQRRLLPAPANTAAMVPVIAVPLPRQPAVAAQLPAVMTPPVETAATPQIEPAPSPIEVAAPLPRPDSLGPKMSDSTSKKAMKGILRAVSGKDKPPTKR